MAKRTRKLTMSEVATEVGVSAPAIANYLTRGLPCTRRPGRANLFDADEVREWMAENRLNGKPGRPVLTGDEELDELKRQKEAELVAYYRLRNEQTRRELVPVAEVERLGAEVFRVLASRLYGFPSAVVPRLEGQAPHEQMAILGDCIRDIAGQFQKDISGLGDRIAVSTALNHEPEPDEEQPPLPAKSNLRKVGKK